MAKPDITQTPEAQRLNAEVQMAYTAYVTIAEHTSALWKAAGRPREGGYFDPKSKAYTDYQNAVEDKLEAYNAWQRAAARHGKYLLPQAEQG